MLNRLYCSGSDQVSGLSSKINDGQGVHDGSCSNAEISNNDGLHCTNITRTNVSFTPKTECRKFDKKYVDSHN
jgi:hypothetical protein